MYIYIYIYIYIHIFIYNKTLYLSYRDHNQLHIDHPLPRLCIIYLY